MIYVELEREDEWGETLDVIEVEVSVSGVSRDYGVTFADIEVMVAQSGRGGTVELTAGEEERAKDQAWLKYLADRPMR